MKRRLLEIPVVAMLIMTLTVPVFAASKTLGVSEIDQNKTKWCWASCSEMIGKYYNSGSNRDQYAIVTINEQISNFAQTYPTNLKASSNEALLFMRRYRFANCSCFSCCFKDAYPSSNVQ